MLLVVSGVIAVHSVGRGGAVDNFLRQWKKSNFFLHTIEVVWVPVLMTVAPMGLLNGWGVVCEVAGGLGRVLSQD
jgi:hypothetical protein